MRAMTSIGSIAKRAAREPLLQFTVIGAGLFGLYSWVSGEEEAPRPAIVVSRAFEDELARGHAARIGRTPSDEEREELVVGFVREEVLVREAARLGLDRGDPIVRRRLAQKVEFLLEGLASIEAPTDDELRTYLAAHRERYERPGRVAFEHVFFSRDRRGEHAASDARRALAGDPAEAGDPFVLGSRFGLDGVERIGGRFGAAFASSLAALPLEAWSGPIESTYGAHLVRVTEREPARPATLEEARDAVTRDLAGERRRDSVEREVDALVAGYDVRREP
jgi:peptidyl-prolyl cis-trans isomerase C